MTKEDALFFLARFRTKGINEKLYDALGVAIEALNAQPSAADTNVVTTDTISRRGAIKAIKDALLSWSNMPEWRENKIVGALDKLPPEQPNLSEAYSKAVFTWLMNYQIRTAELKGRYTPYEVLSWVINDWRKENE